MTKTELLELIKLGEGLNIRLNIKELKTLNLIERIGSDKKGHWLIKGTERIG